MKSVICRKRTSSAGAVPAAWAKGRTSVIEKSWLMSTALARLEVGAGRPARARAHRPHRLVTRRGPAEFIVGNAPGLCNPAGIHDAWTAFAARGRVRSHGPRYIDNVKAITLRR